MNNSEFKYKIENDTIIIEKCPNDILTRMHILQLNKFYSKTGNFYLCDGIKEIGKSAFAFHDFINSIRLPNTLKKIDNHAFEQCLELKEIIIPESVEQIGEYAFSDCRYLEKVVLPNNIKQINTKTFSDCYRLKDIVLPSSLESIGASAFENCSELIQIKLPESLKYIGESAFHYCKTLKEITIPEGIEELNETFLKCYNLTKVNLPTSLKKLGPYSFYDCMHLSSISFKEGVEVIGEKAFCECGNLKEVILPNSLKVIGEKAFSECIDLKEVVLPDSLKIIGKRAFYFSGLISVNIKDGVEKINEGAFSSCAFLEEATLGKGLKKIEKSLFSGCEKLKKIVIPEGVKEIQKDAFLECNSLEEIKFPSTLDIFSEKAITYCSNLQKIILNDNGEEKEIKLNSLMFMRDHTKKLFIYDSFSRNTLGFYNDGKYFSFDMEFITKNSVIKRMMEERKVNSDNFVSLYHWLNKKFIPSHIVIKNMPLKDIDNFFINKNYIEWGKLLKEYPVYYDENKASFFKLCYVLGVFNKSTKIRNRAVNFIKENILPTFKEEEIHSKFDGFDLDNGYNNDFAEFYIEYFDGHNFLNCIEEYDLDLTAACYNNFDNVKKFYPNKTIHTNREADLLLPKHVMDAVLLTEYDNVDEGNEEFAKAIGRYGYSQEQFEKLQEWYNEGKNIKQMKLFISDDEEEKGITYKLLNKDNPICAVLGNITNCCQVAGGQGESCVKYGMTKPNSGFITFNYNERIIGQAWVWYDEESKTVCLDNIEVPNKYLEKIEHNKEIQDNFIACLLRIEENFKKEMNDKGLRVNQVTIGHGYNDISEILDKKFMLVKDCGHLSNYNGYSDANNQYEIKKLDKQNSRK